MKTKTKKMYKKTGAYLRKAFSHIENERKTLAFLKGMKSITNKLDGLIYEEISLMSKEKRPQIEFLEIYNLGGDISRGFSEFRNKVFDKYKENEKIMGELLS